MNEKTISNMRIMSKIFLVAAALTLGCMPAFPEFTKVRSDGGWNGKVTKLDVIGDYYQFTLDKFRGEIVIETDIEADTIYLPGYKNTKGWVLENDKAVKIQINNETSGFLCVSYDRPTNSVAVAYGSCSGTIAVDKNWVCKGGEVNFSVENGDVSASKRWGLLSNNSLDTTWLPTYDDRDTFVYTVSDSIEMLLKYTTSSGLVSYSSAKVGLSLADCGYKVTSSVTNICPGDPVVLTSDYTEATTYEWRRENGKVVAVTTEPTVTLRPLNASTYRLYADGMFAGEVKVEVDGCGFYISSYYPTDMCMQDSNSLVAVGEDMLADLGNNVFNWQMSGDGKIWTTIKTNTSNRLNVFPAEDTYYRAVYNTTGQITSPFFYEVPDCAENGDCHGLQTKVLFCETFGYFIDEHTYVSDKEVFVNDMTLTGAVAGFVNGNLVGYAGNYSGDNSGVDYMDRIMYHNNNAPYNNGSGFYGVRLWDQNGNPTAGGSLQLAPNVGTTTFHIQRYIAPDPNGYVVPATQFTRLDGRSNQFVGTDGHLYLQANPILPEYSWTENEGAGKAYRLQDGYYAIVANPDSVDHHDGNSYVDCTDNTGNVNGAMLFVNCGETSKSKAAIYARRVHLGYSVDRFAFSMAVKNATAREFTYDGDLQNPINVSVYLLTDDGSDTLPDSYRTMGTVPAASILNNEIESGDIPAGSDVWHTVNQYVELDPTQKVQSLWVVLFNNGPSGNGNDLLLDDISLSACLPKDSDILGFIRANKTTTCLGSSVRFSVVNNADSSQKYWGIRTGKDTTWLPAYENMSAFDYVVKDSLTTMVLRYVNPKGVDSISEVTVRASLVACGHTLQSSSLEISSGERILLTSTYKNASMYVWSQDGAVIDTTADPTLSVNPLKTTTYSLSADGLYVGSVTVKVKEPDFYITPYYPTTMCRRDSNSLVVTGSDILSAMNDDVFEWQTSEDGVSWTVDKSSKGSRLTVLPTKSMYYRVIYTNDWLVSAPFFYEVADCGDTMDCLGYQSKTLFQETFGFFIDEHTYVSDKEVFVNDMTVKGGVAGYSNNSLVGYAGNYSGDTSGVDYMDRIMYRNNTASYVNGSGYYSVREDRNGSLMTTKEGTTTFHIEKYVAPDPNGYVVPATQFVRLTAGINQFVGTDGHLYLQANPLLPEYDWTDNNGVNKAFRLQDGYYAIVANPDSVDRFGHSDYLDCQDATGNGNGAMLLVNCGYTSPGKAAIYARRVDLGYSVDRFSFSMNVKNATKRKVTSDGYPKNPINVSVYLLEDLGSDELPDSYRSMVSVPAANVLNNEIESGNIPAGSDMWHTINQYVELDPSRKVSSLWVVLYNNSSSGDGNDLLLDDISLSACLPEGSDMLGFIRVNKTTACLGSSVRFSVVNNADSSQKYWGIRTGKDTTWLPAYENMSAFDYVVKDSLTTMVLRYVNPKGVDSISEVTVRASLVACGHTLQSSSLEISSGERILLTSTYKNASMYVWSQDGAVIDTTADPTLSVNPLKTTTYSLSADGLYVGSVTVKVKEPDFYITPYYPTTMCRRDSNSLVVTGSDILSAMNDDVFEWQTSEDGVSWTVDKSSKGSRLTVLPTKSMYYRVIYTNDWLVSAPFFYEVTDCGDTMDCQGYQSKTLFHETFGFFIDEHTYVSDKQVFVNDMTLKGGVAAKKSGTIVGYAGNHSSDTSGVDYMDRIMFVDEDSNGSGFYSVRKTQSGTLSMLPDEGTTTFHIRKYVAPDPNGYVVPATQFTQLSGSSNTNQFVGVNGHLYLQANPILPEYSWTDNKGKNKAFRLQDGYYAIVANPDSVDNHGHADYLDCLDATGNENGAMLLVNCGETNMSKPVIYARRVVLDSPTDLFSFSMRIRNAAAKKFGTDGVAKNPVNVSVYLLKDNTGSDLLPDAYRREETIDAVDVLNNEVTSGDIPAAIDYWTSINQYVQLAGNQKVNSLWVALYNNGYSGDGNDLLLDDISLSACMPTEEIVTSVADDVDSGFFMVCSEKGRVIVRSSYSCDVNIWTLDGRIVRSFGVEANALVDCQLQAGVYLVNGRKVVVE